MRLRSRLWSLIRQDRAAVAVTVAVFLTGLVGVTGAAVDMGRLYSARAELQNAADASAKAGADSMVVYDAANNASTECDLAVATAKNISISNASLGENLTLLDQDITMGFWDLELKEFDAARTGPSADPKDLTGFRVTIRRDAQANSPVTTIFASLLGIKQIDLSATSTSYLGYAANVEAGEVDLPIVVNKDALTGGGDGPNCGGGLEFHSENDENSEWTTFFTWPTNDPNVKKYIDGSLETPAVQVGDELNVVNGNLSNNTFDTLYDRFQAEGSDNDGDGFADEWIVLLPAVEQGGAGATTSTVVGFAHMVITAVNPAPDKSISGFLQCDMVIPNSETGGQDFGTRATFSKLAQ